jgi:hypothetical protein
MGWYFRKSVGLGPLRLNLSKSGIGYSVGVRGARIGSGPRGNYVRLGRGGVYYQKYFSPTSSHAVPPPAVNTIQVAQTDQPILTASASHLQDSTSTDLLAEIGEKHAKVRFGPIVGAAFLIVMLMLLSIKPPLWMPLVLAVVFIALFVVISRGDYERKLVELNYDLDEAAGAKYVSFLNSIQMVAGSSRVWQVTSENRFADRKYNAGAGTLLSRKAVSFQLSAPPYVKTEVAVWCLPLGSQKLYFFPDRILVYEVNQVGAARYEGLTIAVKQVQFVEADSVPSDSRVVGYTWQYVNKNGGPDRRFSNNRQIPQVIYGEITISSNDGMNFVLQSSDPQKAFSFKSGVDAYVSSSKSATV